MVALTPIHPPTVAEFIDMIARRYAQITVEWGTEHQIQLAKKSLLLQSLAEIYGPDHPMTTICRSMHRIERITHPANFHPDDLETVQSQLGDIVGSAEELEKLVLSELE